MTPAAWLLGAAAPWLSSAQNGATGRAEALPHNCGGDSGAGLQPCVAIVHCDAQLTVDVAGGRVSGTVVMTAVGRGEDAGSVQLGMATFMADAPAGRASARRGSTRRWPFRLGASDRRRPGHRVPQGRVRAAPAAGAAAPT